MRVCHVVPTHRPYGAFKVAVELSRALAGECDSMVASNLQPDGVAFVKLDLPLEEGWPAGVRGYLALRGKWRKAAAVLEEVVSSRGVDVVHFHLPNAAMLASLYRGVRTKVATVHGPMYESAAGKLAGGLVLGKAFDGLRSVSYPGPYLKELVDRLAPGRGRLIPNGVDIEEVRRLAEEPASVEKGEPTITFPGRVEARKGQLLLVKAMPSLLAAFPKMRCLFIGEGPGLEGLKALVKPFASVSLLGFVENPYPVMRQSDVIVTHLAEGSPGVGLVHLETAALGKPMVTRFDPERYAALGDAPSYVRSEGSEEIVTRVREALSRRPSYEIGALTWRSIGRQYLQLYKEALGG